MAGLEGYQVINLTIPAGEQVVQDIAGEYVACVDSSAPFYVGADYSPPQFFERGLFFKPKDDFKQLTFLNQSGDPLTISVAVGNGDFKDSRLTIGGGLTVRPASPDVIVETAKLTINGGTTHAIPAIANQKEILISYLPTSSNAVPIYVGSTGTAEAGVRLVPGGSVVLETSADLVVKNLGTVFYAQISYVQTGWSA